MLAFLHGLSLVSSVLPVLTIMKPEEMRREKKMQMLFAVDVER